MFSKFIQPGQIVLDVGANIGAFTIPFANQVGPTGIVHAFEPQRQLSQMISTNVALNQLPNVHVHNVAVGNQFGGSIQVPKLDYSKSANFGAISIHPNEMDWTKQGDTESVPVMTLDSKFYVPGSICPSFLKIDAEGMELMVLQGSQQLIAECLPVLHLENNCVKDSPDILRFIDKFGAYHCHWDVHPYFSSQNYAGETTSVFSEYAYSINVLCYPKDKEVSHIEELQDITRIDFENQKLLLSEYGLSFAGSTNVVGQLGNEMECIR